MASCYHQSYSSFNLLDMIAKKTVEGKLGEALQDTGNYILTRQKIDAENLKKLTDGLSRSRAKLLSGMNSQQQLFEILRL